MSTSATGERQSSAFGKLAILAVKLVVIAACFWYLQQQVNVASTAHLLRELDLRWFCLASLMVWLQIPLAGWRLARIFDALGWRTTPAPVGVMTAITAIGVLFSQILPTLVGEGARAWLMVRAGSGWRLALMSVAADRGIGVIALFVLAFVILLFPSALAAVGGRRELVLAGLGAIVLLSLVALAQSERLARVLARQRLTRPFAPVAATLHRLIATRSIIGILVIAFAIHAMTIFAIWLLAIAQNQALPIGDAAVLFALMTSISLVPITINGWGLREVAVTALLQADGISAEHALFFSISFGLAVMTSAIPGAIVWALYPSKPTLALHAPPSDPDIDYDRMAVNVITASPPIDDAREGTGHRYSRDPQGPRTKPYDRSM
jgi:uncharacterized membrane protein YbhN (UPF0104 family)